MSTFYRRLIAILLGLTCLTVLAQLAGAQVCANQSTSNRTAPIILVCSGFLNQIVKIADTKILFAAGIEAPVSYIEPVPNEPNNRYFVFFIPPDLPAGKYAPIISGITTFPGGNKTFQTSRFFVVLDESPNLKTANPMKVSAGAQDVTVQLIATKPVFPIGLFEASFGPGISVGGGSEGGFGPVLVSQTANNAPGSFTADVSLKHQPERSTGPASDPSSDGGVIPNVAWIHRSSGRSSDDF